MQHVRRTFFVSGTLATSSTFWYPVISKSRIFLTSHETPCIIFFFNGEEQACSLQRKVELVLAFVHLYFKELVLALQEQGPNMVCLNLLF